MAKKHVSRLTRPSPIEEVALRIHHEVRGGYQAGQKIVAERKLALLLDTSQCNGSGYLSSCQFSQEVSYEFT